MLLKFVFIMAFALALPAISFGSEKPLCKGNKKMSADAIQKAAEDRFGGPCKVRKHKKNMDWPAKGLEGYSAEVKCPNTPLRKYHSSIKKEENDKNCSLRYTKLSPMDGSQCGLTDNWGGDEEESGPQWKFNKRAEIKIQDLTPEKVRALPEVTQKQLIVTLSDEAGNDAVKAVKFIQDGGSEGGEGYVHQFSFKGKQYDAVEYYPGGNSYGKIFLRGKSEPIAENGDGSISCAE